MHPLTFQFKRAHLSAVAFGRKIFRGTKAPDDPAFDGVPDMTPARFDILTVIHGRPARFMGKFTAGTIPMSVIAVRLGLSRATVSVAIKRLVELGLVTTEKWNGRSKLVALTKEGFKRIHRAFHLVFTGRELSRHLRHLFGQRIGWPKKHLAAEIEEAMHEAWWMTNDVAHHLGDTSEMLYDFRTSVD